MSTTQNDGEVSVNRETNIIEKNVNKMAPPLTPKRSHSSIGSNFENNESSDNLDEDDLNFDRKKTKKSDGSGIKTNSIKYVKLSEYVELKKTCDLQAKLLQDLIEKVKNIESEMEMLKVNDKTTLNNNFSVKPLFSNLFKGNSKEKKDDSHLQITEVNILNAVNSENAEMKKREKSILIMGIKESTGENKIESDKSLVHDLFDKINISKHKIKSIYRFNKKNESNYPAIIKVELNDADDKNYILKASKLLKSIENYKQVYINNNLTPAQRKIEIELIKARNTANDERSTEQKSKFYFAIRSGKVIPKFYKDDNFGNANK